MTKRRKQGLTLLVLSGPMLWFGFSNFIAGGINSTALAIGIALASTLGIFFGISGLVLLITKNSLGIWNPDNKPEKKGRGEEILVSQTSEDSPIPKELQRDLIIQSSLARAWRAHKEPINKNPKVNEMAKVKDTVANTVKEIRELEEEIMQTEERIKKDTLAVKTATEKRAVLKDNLAKDKTVQELLAMLS